MTDEMHDKTARLKIIECARRLFSQLGLDGASTRDIARESGTNVSLISYYFGGKEKLYEAVIREFALFVRSELDPIYQENASEVLTSKIFRQKTRMIVSKMLDLHLHNPEMGVILEREKLNGLQYSREVHETIFLPIGKAFSELVDRGKVAGFIKSDINSKAFFILMVQSIFGFVMMSTCKASSLSEETFKLPEEKEQFVDFVVNIFIEGIMK